jgi:hypothetical protein
VDGAGVEDEDVGAVMHAVGAGRVDECGDSGAVVGCDAMTKAGRGGGEGRGDKAARLVAEGRRDVEEEGVGLDAGERGAGEQRAPSRSGGRGGANGADVSPEPVGGRGVDAGFEVGFTDSAFAGEEPGGEATLSEHEPPARRKQRCEVADGAELVVGVMDDSAGVDEVESAGQFSGQLLVVEIGADRRDVDVGRLVASGDVEQLGVGVDQ